MENTAPQCQNFCTLLVRHPEITNATARIGAWLLGVSVLTGMKSISLSYRQIRDGFTMRGVQVPGTGSHIDTVKQSVDWLEKQGVIKTTPGDPTGFGHFARVYSITM